jgi:hypothetical protein
VIGFKKMRMNMQVSGESNKKPVDYFLKGINVNG